MKTIEFIWGMKEKHKKGEGIEDKARMWKQQFMLFRLSFSYTSTKIK